MERPKVQFFLLKKKLTSGLMFFIEEKIRRLCFSIEKKIYISEVSGLNYINFFYRKNISTEKSPLEFPPTVNVLMTQIPYEIDKKIYTFTLIFVNYN